jgi:hypothetical protein
MPGVTWIPRTHNQRSLVQIQPAQRAKAQVRRGVEGSAPLFVSRLQTICKRATEIPSEQKFGHSHFPFEPVMVDRHDESGGMAQDG